MALRSGRAGRPAVIDRPVVRTAAAVGSAATVARAVQCRRTPTTSGDIAADSRTDPDPDPERTDP